MGIRKPEARGGISSGCDEGRRRDWGPPIALLLASILLPIWTQLAHAYPRPGSTERIEIGPGLEAAHPLYSSVSANGRVVTFDTWRGELSKLDLNGSSDVYVVHLQTGSTELASVSSLGLASINPGLAGSRGPSISADGRFVAFTSTAADLVPGDTNGETDVFVRDLKQGVTERVSVGMGGSQASGGSGEVSISATGRYVAFSSDSPDLVDDDTNGVKDIFLRDRRREQTVRISVGEAGEQADSADARGLRVFQVCPSISASGRYVVFTSGATNLDKNDRNMGNDVFLHDVRSKKTEIVSLASDGTEARHPLGWESGTCSSHGVAPARAISADGRYIAFYANPTNLVPSDGNNAIDIFVRDRKLQRTERVSIGSWGQEALGQSGSFSLSADGRYVAFGNGAANLAAGDDPDVAESLAPGLIGGDWDVFVHDRETGTTEHVSQNRQGDDSDCELEAMVPLPLPSPLPDISIRSTELVSYYPSLDEHARTITFSSCAGDLVEGDDDLNFDVFVRHRGPDLGVGSMEAEESQQSVTLAGRPSFQWSGMATYRDSPDDAGLQDLGAEILWAKIVQRPDLGDLYVRMEVDRLPQVGSLTGVLPAPVVYGVRLTTPGSSYELRAQGFGDLARSGGSFMLFRCFDRRRCSETGEVNGGFGTVGEAVVAAIPLRKLGLVRGGTILEVEFFSGVGTLSAGANKVLDVLRALK